MGERDHIHGAPRAPVTLVEYGDFECPRRRTLASSHGYPFRAARAAEAAAAVGRSWEMNDLLYAHQEALEDEHLAAHAARLGPDADAITRELRDEVCAERVREDPRGGAASGVSGTPTLSLDGILRDPEAHVEALAVPAGAEAFETIAGHGVRAQVEGHEVLVGTRRLLEREGVPRTACSPPPSAS
jgi:protein-disulfide isomerase